MAGESAQDLARRQRERAERLLRSAERYEQGAHGERATGAILDELRQHGWAVFHDVRWPGRPRANIDHVAVGPPGVFVIDSKNWSGRIDVADQTFRRDGRRQDKVVASAGDAALAVAALVGPEACASTRSVLCFVRDEPLFGWCHDVMVCSTGNLHEILLSRPAVLTVDQVRTTGLGLHLGFQANVSAPGSRAPRPGCRRWCARWPRRGLRAAGSEQASRGRSSGWACSWCSPWCSSASCPGSGRSSASRSPTH